MNSLETIYRMHHHPVPHLEHDFEDETIYRIQHHPVHPINP